MILVLEKAFNILELLASDASRDFPLGEISSALDLDRGTCANIMKTLKLRGYVDQSSPRKGYRLGYMIYRLGDSYVNNEQLTAQARPYVDRLSAQFNECILLSVIKQDKRVALHVTMPDQELVVRTSREIPVYRATTGRMILSYYSSEELVRFVRRFGLPKAGDWEGVTSFESLQKELDKARKQGWRKDSDRHHIVGLAVPVWKGNKVVASLGVYLPEFRYTDNSAILPALQETAQTLGLVFSESGI